MDKKETPWIPFTGYVHRQPKFTFQEREELIIIQITSIVSQTDFLVKQCWVTWQTWRI